MVWNISIIYVAERGGEFWKVVSAPEANKHSFWCQEDNHVTILCRIKHCCIRHYCGKCHYVSYTYVSVSLRFFPAENHQKRYTWIKRSCESPNCWRKNPMFIRSLQYWTFYFYLTSSTVTRLSSKQLDHDDRDYSLWRIDKLVNKVLLSPTAVDKDKLLLLLMVFFSSPTVSSMKCFYGGQNLERRIFLFQHKK